MTMSDDIHDLDHGNCFVDGTSLANFLSVLGCDVSELEPENVYSATIIGFHTAELVIAHFARSAHGVDPETARAEVAAGIIHAARRALHGAGH
jgi:hypothetical protein